MARPLRETSRIRTYHIVVTGSNGNNIFNDAADRLAYIDILKCKSLNKKFHIYAYCLMPNHTHMLIKEGLSINISQIMKIINTAYTYYFNLKYKRKGSLFHDRFRSQPINNINQLAAAIHFIHENPVIESAEELSTCEWSSYKAYHEFVAIKKVELKEKDHICSSTEYDFINLEEICRELLVDKLNIEAIVSNSENYSKDSFIEGYSNMRKHIDFLDYEEAQAYVENFLGYNHISLQDLKANKDLRNELIQKLKAASNLSIRKIAELLNINRGVVQRTKITLYLGLLYSRDA